MGRMIFDLTDEDREALEAIRKNRGHRSHAETLRELIRQTASSGLPPPERQAAMKAVVRAEQAKWATPQELKRAREILPEIDWEEVATSSSPNVLLAGTFERKPYQKGKKK